MENGRCKSGHSSLTGCPEGVCDTPLRMFLGALRMTSAGMWLRFGCLGVLISCSPTADCHPVVESALYAALIAVAWLIYRCDRKRFKRIADYLEKY